MLIGYLGVSKSDESQTTSLQRDALIENGVDPTHIYEDHASDRIDERLGLSAALKALRHGDVLIVWKLDRLGRSLHYLVNAIHDLSSRGIGFKVLTGPGASIDTTIPSGKLVFDIFAALAEFELISTIGNAEVYKTWENYFQDTLNIGSQHKTLLLAQKYFQLENKIGGMAADLGAGTGRDTLFLLQEGWNVLALDAEKLSIDIILNRVDVLYPNRLKVMVMPFSEMTFTTEFDLINASYSLPFCKPQDFSECWRKISDHLAIGGRFSGQFFGEKDEWATNPELTIHSREKMLQLFEDQFVIEYLQIEDGLIPSADGKMKHWHIYHLVAKKKR